MSDDAIATDRHLHWEFMAFDAETMPGPGESIHWPISVSVIGQETEEEARIAAEFMVRRAFYVLRKVWECPACGYQKQLAKTMQNMVDAMKE